MSDVNSTSGLSPMALLTALNTSSVINDDAAAAQNASRPTIDIKNPLIPTAVLSSLYKQGVALEHQVGDEFKVYKDPLDKTHRDEIQNYLNNRTRYSKDGDLYTDKKTGVKFKLDQLGYEEKVKLIIDNRVDKGRYELTPGGQIKDTNTGTVFEEGTVGFQLQTFVISRLQDQIKDINGVISRLTVLNDWVTQNQITDKDNENQSWDTGIDASNVVANLYNPGRYPQFMISEGYSAQQAKEFIIDTNNEFVAWLGITKNAKTFEKEIAFQKGKFAVFDTGRMTNDVVGVRVSSTTFTNATERMRNLVKEKSTQAEQLGTDFQSRNSRFNAVIEAMTNYTKTYFGAVKNFVS